MFRRRRPRNRTELLAQADRARSRGRLKKAIAGYREALALSPGDPAIHAKLAPLLVRRRLKPEALESFALAADGQLKAGFTDRAISLRRQAAETFPEELSLWEELTHLYLGRERRADAVAALLAGARALRRPPHREIGIQVLRRALELDPRHVEATLLMARLLARCGRTGEALPLLDALDGRVAGATRRRARRLAFRLSPTPRRLWRWMRAADPRRGLVSALALALALGAIPAGIALMASPDGSLLGLPPSILAGTPFADFTLPGLVLAAVVGGSTLAAAVQALRDAPSAPRLALVAGLLVVGWIAVQVALLGSLSPLQPVVGGLGLALVALAWRPR